MSRKILIIMIIGILTLSCLPLNGLAYTSARLNNLSFGEIENMGAPILESFLLTHHTERRASDGKNIMYTATTGKPAMFIVYNLDDNIIENTVALQSPNQSKPDTPYVSKTVYCIIRDNRDNVYISTQSNSMFFRYNLTENKLYTYGLNFSETASYHPVVDRDNNCYFGTYPNAKMLKYNASLDVVEDLGVMLPGENYIHSMAMQGDYIYGGGNAPNTKMFKYNYKTGEKTFISAPTIGDIGTIGVKDYYSMKVSGNYLFVLCKATNNSYYMCVMDLLTETWTDSFHSAAAFHPTDLDGDVVYLFRRKPGDTMFSMHSYNPQTKELTKIFNEYFSESVAKPTFVTLDQTKFPGKSIVTVSYKSGCPVVFNLQNKTTTYLTESNFPADKVEIRSMMNGINDELVISGYMGERGVLFDLRTNDLTRFTLGQAEGMTVYDNKYYFGIYTRAQMIELDPSLPLSSTNPKNIGNMDAEKQDRPFLVKPAGQYVAFGTTPTYGILGGAIGLYDPVSKTKKVYKNFNDNRPENAGKEHNQSIGGMTYKDGKIYGSTHIWGGLGISPVLRPAEVFRMDVETGNVELSVAPTPSKADKDLYHIGDLSFGPDGKLWAISNGLIFSMNPETFEIIDQIVVGPIGCSINSEGVPAARYNPYMMEWIDGLLYTTANNRLFIVDPETLEFKNSPAPLAYKIVVAPDGYVYYTDHYSTDLFRMKLIKPDITPPLSVNNVVTTKGKGQVNLTWREPSDFTLSHILIDVYKNDIPVQTSIRVEKGIKAATILNLENHVEYTFKLKCVDTGNNVSIETVAKETPTDITNNIPILLNYSLVENKENYIVNWQQGTNQTYNLRISGNHGVDEFLNLSSASKDITSYYKTSPIITVDLEILENGVVLEKSNKQFNLNFAGGEGTVELPYKIATVRHFNNVNNQTNKQFIQIENIRLNNFEPINDFSGNYNGNNKFLELTIYKPNLDQVAFIKTLTGKVENLIMKGYVTGKSNVGSVCVINKGEIINVTNEMVLSSTTGTTGGICAVNENRVQCAINNGKITVSGISGGIAAINKGTISVAKNDNVFEWYYPINNGTWTTEQYNELISYNHIGGIAGQNGGTIEKSYNLSTMNCQKGVNVGGIAGSSFMNNTMVSKCYNLGKIIGAKSVSGIYGMIYGDKGSIHNIEYTYNKGDIETSVWRSGIVACLGQADENTVTVKLNEVYDAQTIPCSMVAWRATPSIGSHAFSLTKSYFLDDTSTVSGRGTRITSENLKKLDFVAFNNGIWETTTTGYLLPKLKEVYHEGYENQTTLSGTVTIGENKIASVNKGVRVILSQGDLEQPIQTTTYNTKGNFIIPCKLTTGTNYMLTMFHNEMYNFSYEFKITDEHTENYQISNESYPFKLTVKNLISGIPINEYTIYYYTQFWFGVSNPNVEGFDNMDLVKDSTNSINILDLNYLMSLKR